MHHNRNSIKGYKRKIAHKNRLKRDFARRGGSCYWFGGYASWEDYVANHGEFDSLNYWRRGYFSGSRKFAKRSTNRVIRAKEKQLLRTEDSDIALKGGEYRKAFDYGWTVY